MDGVGLIFFFFQLPITEYFLTVFPSSTEWMDGVGQILNFSVTNYKIFLNFNFFQLPITEYFLTVFHSSTEWMDGGGLILIFFSYQLRNIS